MANVDPFVIKWPDKWIADPEIGPVIQYLNRFLHDLWLRTGGGPDFVDDSALQIKDLNQVVSGHSGDIGKLRAINNGVVNENKDDRQHITGLTSDIGKIRAINNDQKKSINILIALSANNNQLIAGLVSDNGKLRARLNDQHNEISNVNQLLAELQ